MNQLRPLAPKQPWGASTVPVGSRTTRHAEPRPTQRRNHHTENEWNSQREILTDLYINKNKNVDDIVGIMRGSGFTASRRQYLTKFKQWRLQKNLKNKDMRILIAKSEKRKIQSGKETIFFLNGNPLSIERLERFKGRPSLRDWLVASPSDKTPEGIYYRTPAGPQGSPPGEVISEITSESEVELHFTSPVSKVTTLEGYLIPDEPINTRATHGHRLGRFGISFTSNRLAEENSIDIIRQAFNLALKMHSLIGLSENPSTLEEPPIVQQSQPGSSSPKFWIVYSGNSPEVLDKTLRDNLICHLQASNVISQILSSENLHASRPQWNKDWTPMTCDVGNKIEAAGRLLFGPNTPYYAGMTLIEIFVLFGLQSNDADPNFVRITLGVTHRSGPACHICDSRFATLDCIDATGAVKVQVPLKDEPSHLEDLQDIHFYRNTENVSWTDRLHRLEGWEIFPPCQKREKYTSEPFLCYVDDEVVVDQSTWDPTGGAGSDSTFQPFPLNRERKGHVCSSHIPQEENFDPHPTQGEREWDPEGLDWTVYDGEFDSD